MIPEHIHNNLESLYYKRKQSSINLYIFVVLVILIIFGSLPFIHIDITSQHKGITRSLYENSSVFSLVSGRVIENNIQNNNQAVNKGDTLLIIASDIVKNEIGSANYSKTLLESQINDINNLSQGKSAQTELYRQERQLYEQKQIEAESNMKQAKSVFENQSNLFNRGYTSALDFEKAKKDYQIAISQMNQVQNQFKKSLQESKNELLVQSKSKELELRQQELQKANYLIQATETGSIINYKPIAIEGFVSANNPICEIASSQEQVVEVYVSPSEIGFIRKGQKVKFQIDAYNYNQWGLASGQVIDIDQNITIADQKEYYFKVRCRLDKEYLTLKNRYRGNITKGMTLTARFFITNRTLWQLLFDKIDDWINPKIIKTRGQ